MMNRLNKWSLFIVFSMLLFFVFGCNPIIGPVIIPDVTYVNENFTIYIIGNASDNSNYQPMAAIQLANSSYCNINYVEVVWNTTGTKHYQNMTYSQTITDSATGNYTPLAGQQWWGYTLYVGDTGAVVYYNATIHASCNTSSFAYFVTGSGGTWANTYSAYHIYNYYRYPMTFTRLYPTLKNRSPILQPFIELNYSLNAFANNYTMRFNETEYKELWTNDTTIYLSFDNYSSNINNDSLYGSFDGRLFNWAVYKNSTIHYNYTEGRYGGALDFNRSGYFVTVLEQPYDFDIENDFSMSAWIKPRIDGTNNIIFSKILKDIPYTGFEFYINKDNKLQFNFVNSFAQSPNLYCFVYTDETINDNEWHHVAVTYKGRTSNASKGLSIYLDGINTTLTRIDSGTTTYFYTYTNNLPLAIGSRNGDMGFNGTIDEVRVWRETITEEKIDTVMKTGLSLYNNTRNIVLIHGLYNISQFVNYTYNIKACEGFNDTCNDTEVTLRVSDCLTNSDCTQDSCLYYYCIDSDKYNKMKVENSSFDVMSYFTERGDIGLRGQLTTEADCLTVYGDAYTIDFGAGIVAWINTSGDMCIEGTLEQDLLDQYSCNTGNVLKIQNGSGGLNMCINESGDAKLRYYMGENNDW